MGGFLTPMHRKQAAAQLYALQEEERKLSEAKSPLGDVASAEASAKAERETGPESSREEMSPTTNGTLDCPPKQVVPATSPSLSSLFSSYEKEGESA